MFHSPQLHKRRNNLPRSRTFGYDNDVTAVPQNFIPGYTTPEIKTTPETHRKQRKESNGKKEWRNSQDVSVKTGVKAFCEAGSSPNNKEERKHSILSTLTQRFSWKRERKHKRSTDAIYDKTTRYRPDDVERNGEEILPDKIIRNQIGVRKWKSMETVHRL